MNLLIEKKIFNVCNWIFFMYKLNNSNLFKG